MDRTLLTPAARRRRVRCFEWSLANGRPVTGPGVTAVLGAKSGLSEPVDRWTEEVVRELLWVGIENWCLERGVEVPPDTPEALWNLLDHLTAERALAAGSDPIEALRAPLLDCGGLDGQGRRRFPTRPAAG